MKVSRRKLEHGKRMMAAAVPSDLTVRDVGLMMSELLGFCFTCRESLNLVGMWLIHIGAEIITTTIPPGSSLLLYYVMPPTLL